MGAPPDMQRRPDENVRHHKAFLVYAMQDPKRRSLRATAKALDASDNSARRWRELYDWAGRITDPEHCRHACDLYADLYHRKFGGVEVQAIRSRLGCEYVEPDEEVKDSVARAIDAYEGIEREAYQRKMVAEGEQRAKRLRQVLDGVLTKVGQGIFSKDESQQLKVKVSDIPTVVRGYEALERSEARRIAMVPSGESDSQSSDSTAYESSQRVLQAEQRGGDVMAALEEDAEELLLAIRTMRTHESESNVVQFPGMKRLVQGE